MRLRWFLVILAAAFSLLITGAAALPATASPAVHMATASSAAPLNAPAGCPSGDVCFYYQGNGGSLCGYTDANSTNLRGLAPFGNNCSNIGPFGNNPHSGTIYNNGNTCKGCQDVKLYYDAGYAGAWYCLPRLGYLDHIEQVNFNGGGNADGHGQTLVYLPQPPWHPGPGGVASVQWTSC